MKIAISVIVTCDKRIDRRELIEALIERQHTVVYIGQESNNVINPEFDKYNIEFLSIPIARDNTNPIAEINTLLNVKKTIKNNSLDALIAYGIRTFPAIVIGAKVAGVKKVICIVNGSGSLFQLKGVKGFLVRLMSYPMLWLSFLLADNILFQNPDDMKMIKRKGLLWRNNYGQVNGSGVNLDEYQFEKLETKPVFSMISRLTGSKGVNEYVQAARQVQQMYPETVFYLIGPIDDEASINMIELKKAVDDEVINLVGRVEDVRPYIKKCRVFVLPSYYPEGIPRSILEAMSMGRPIITTDSSGCRETVIEGVNGFLVSPKNVEELTEKMIWMIEHTAEVEKMGRESRKIAEAEYDVNIVNETILNVLHQQ